MGNNTITISDRDFDEVVSSEAPTLVDFWAEWCGPCKMIAPALEELAEKYSGKLTIAKLNVDDNPQTAREHEVMSIPTLLVFKDGIEKRRIVGARSKAQLESELAEFIG